MSTRSTIWLGTDEKGRDCHLYYELAERIPGKAAPIFMQIVAQGHDISVRLPKEIAQKIRDILDPEGAWEII
jgi:hypothetical protein